MSTRPGVTYNPETSTVFNASAGLIVAATAAIFPPAIATSRTALILFRASTTCPPRRSRSYFGVVAAGCGTCRAERDKGEGTREKAKGEKAKGKRAKAKGTRNRTLRAHCFGEPCMVQPLRAARRVAVHVAPRYSPISSGPLIWSPASLPENVRLTESPCCSP